MTHGPNSKMSHLDFLPTCHSFSAITLLVLMTNMACLTLADTFIKSVNPVTSTNFTDQLPAGYYSIPATDDKGNLHAMIISTVSLDSWFASKMATCPGAEHPSPPCGWNPNALYDSTGKATNGTYCSIGVKFDPHPYTECYSIMPNYSIVLGADTAQNPDLQLVASVGFLINSTWDGSQQSGMLGLASTIDKNTAGPRTSVIDAIASGYSQPKQFTLGLSRSEKTGGYLTFGSYLPPNALPLDSPAVFQTPMQSADINGRIDSLYVVSASVAILSAPSMLVQYVIDSGDVYLRVPPVTAQAINGAWNPAGTPMNDGTGRWKLPCDAQAPTIGVTIRNHFFSFNKTDMLWQNQDGQCWSTVVTATKGTYTLGQPFLNNLIVTFDLDNSVMYFQQGGDAMAVTGTTGTSTTHTVLESVMSVIIETTTASATSVSTTVSSISTTAASSSTSAASSSTTPSMVTPTTSSIRVTSIIPADTTANISTTSRSFAGSLIVAGPSHPVQSSNGVVVVSSFVTSTTSTVVVISTSFAA